MTKAEMENKIALLEKIIEDTKKYLDESKDESLAKSLDFRDKGIKYLSEANYERGEYGAYSNALRYIEDTYNFVVEGRV